MASSARRAAGRRGSGSRADDDTLVLRLDYLDYIEVVAVKC